MLPPFPAEPFLWQPVIPAWVPHPSRVRQQVFLFWWRVGGTGSCGIPGCMIPEYGYTASHRLRCRLPELPSGFFHLFFNQSWSCWRMERSPLPFLYTPTALTRSAGHHENRSQSCCQFSQSERGSTLLSVWLTTKKGISLVLFREEITPFTLAWVISPSY